MINHANTLNGDKAALTDSTAPADRAVPPGRTALDVGGFPADAFIYPDEPLVLDKFRSALISPDDPFEPREEERGVVVGMDGSTEHEALGPGGVLLNPDQVADLLEAVSMDLRKNGIHSLRGEGKNNLRREGVPSNVENSLKTHLAEYFSKQH